MNYHNEMLETTNNLDYRPKLLLHSCCGPCSTTVLTILVKYFDITVLYYNPNIEPMEEYYKRKNEQIRFFLTPNYYTLNNSIQELLIEIKNLQEQCPHKFENGFCEYCYKEEK